MEVEVKLFGNLGKYLPDGSDRFSFKKSIDGGTPVGQLLKDMSLPEGLPVLVMVNGTRVEGSHILQDRDEIALFSPAAGG